MKVDMTMRPSRGQRWRDPELETSKEERQSVNEELSIVNAELQDGFHRPLACRQRHGQPARRHRRGHGDVSAVLDSLVRTQAEVQGIRPYRTMENMIEGTVITQVEVLWLWFDQRDCK